MHSDDVTDDDGKPLLIERHPVDVVGLHFGEADSDIERVGTERRLYVALRQRQDAQRHAGVAFPELPHQRPDQVGDEGRGEADA